MGGLAMYTVTGATGNLGKKIMGEALKNIRPSELRVAVRSPEKAKKYFELDVDVRRGDYNDTNQLVEAYKGTDVLIYIPSISHPSIVRVPEFENAIIAAEKAGVKHFLFVGFYADQENNPFHMAPFFGYANRRLAASNLAYTIVKNAMYTDPLVPYLPELIERGKLLYPVGYGKISFISREDSARAIVKVAMDKRLQGKTYTLTQDRNYTMVELAEILSKVSGSEIKFNPLTVKEFGELYDQPKGFGPVLASLYEAGNRGLLSTITEDYRNIVGTDAESLESYLTRNYYRGDFV